MNAPDPLAALDNAEPAPMVPAAASVPDAGETIKLQQRVVELEAELAAANARIEAQAERIASLEKPGGLFGGKAKKRAAELEAEVENLRAENAKLKAEADGASETLLPAVAQVETALAVVSQENDNLKFALAQSQNEAHAARAQLGELEFERDERDALLRDQEGQRQEAERRARLAQEQLALVRASAIRKNDPGAGEPLKGTRLTRLRLQAALGNMGAAVELGGDYLDNTCAFCNASPACTRERLLSWPHGKLVPRNEQEYLKLLVGEAQERGADPFKVLEAWASGMDGDEIIDNLDDGAYAKVAEEQPELEGFAKRAAERRDRDVTERTVAHGLRTLRCSDCRMPLLWHADGDNGKRSEDVCDLGQKAVFARAQAKDIKPVTAEDVLSGGEVIDAVQPEIMED